MSLSHDVFDRVISVTKDGATFGAKYDAFGRRIWRRSTNGTEWIWGDSNQ